jgi:hypothetical protein
MKPERRTTLPGPDHPITIERNPNRSGLGGRPRHSTHTERVDAPRGCPLESRSGLDDGLLTAGSAGRGTSLGRSLQFHLPCYFELNKPRSTDFPIWK